MRITTKWLSAVAVSVLGGCAQGAPSSSWGSSQWVGTPVGAPAEAAGPLALGPGAEGAPELVPPELRLPEVMPEASATPGEVGETTWHDGLLEPVPPVDGRPRPRRQWDHVVENGGGACREELAASGAKFSAIPDRATPDAKGCGIPHGVLLSRGPTGIRYSPPVSLDCSLARRLVDVERVLQEEAASHLGSSIQRVGTLGSYACRKVIGRLAGGEGISEHSFGNALDLSRFDTAHGKQASVLRAYEPGAAEPRTAEGRFLRAVARRLRREAGVRVLGPDFDASHRDHFHLDAGLPRWR